MHESCIACKALCNFEIRYKIYSLLCYNHTPKISFYIPKYTNYASIMPDWKYKMVDIMCSIRPEGCRYTLNTENKNSPVWLYIPFQLSQTELIRCGSRVQGAEEEDLNNL